MTTLTLEKDLHLIGSPASSFPEGIPDAFHQLHARVPDAASRTFYGISWSDENGKIMYTAAAEALYEGEAAACGLRPFTVKKGRFRSILVKDWEKDVPAIGRAFTELLKSPDKDPLGYCLEKYTPEGNVHCMLPLLDTP